MIRRTMPWEEEHPLPKLSEKEKTALDKVDIDSIIAMAVAQLPPMERKCWKVMDIWGRLIKRYATRKAAVKSAINRNRRAKRWGLYMRYIIGRDEGFDEQ